MVDVGSSCSSPPLDRCGRRSQQQKQATQSITADPTDPPFRPRGWELVEETNAHRKGRPVIFPPRRRSPGEPPASGADCGYVGSAVMLCFASLCCWNPRSQQQSKAKQGMTADPTDPPKSIRGPGQKRGSSDERTCVGRIARLSRESFFSIRNSRFGGVGSQKSRPKTPHFP